MGELSKKVMKGYKYNVIKSCIVAFYVHNLSVVHAHMHDICCGKGSSASQISLSIVHTSIPTFSGGNLNFFGEVGRDGIYLSPFFGCTKGMESCM